MQIFIVQGAVIGVIGTLLGFAGGLALAYNVDVVVPALETALGFKFLSKDVYQIPDLPSKVEGMDVAIVCAVSLVLSLLATLYPSWRASRVNPAEALRYE
jgi:lipoprotein-releasing system permease protein